MTTSKDRVQRLIRTIAKDPEGWTWRDAGTTPQAKWVQNLPGFEDYREQSVDDWRKASLEWVKRLERFATPQLPSRLDMDTLRKLIEHLRAEDFVHRGTVQDVLRNTHVDLEWLPGYLSWYYRSEGHVQKEDDYFWADILESYLPADEIAVEEPAVEEGDVITAPVPLQQITVRTVLDCCKDLDEARRFFEILAKVMPSVQIEVE